MLEYKCPCCGGAINFDSKLQKMKCPYCDTEFDMETLKSYDEDLKKNTQDNMNWDNSNEQTFTDEETEGMSVYVCNSCGGEIVADENTGATSCPYCGNPVVLKGRFSGDLKPDYVIPFRLTKEDAIKALSKHVNKKLVPKIFKDKNHIDQIRGMYVPFWLFDADTEAHIQYKGTKVRHWSDSDYNYTETKYYLVGRGGNVGFTNVPVDGSSQMPDDLMESIEPFNFDEAVDFQTAYLAGYLADKYDVTKENIIHNFFLTIVCEIWNTGTCCTDSPFSIFHIQQEKNTIVIISLTITVIVKEIISIFCRCFVTNRLFGNNNNIKCIFF